MKTIRFLLIFFLTTFFSVSLHAQTTGIYRAKFESEGLYLTIEVLDDDLAHFEISTTPTGDTPIWTSPMVIKTDYMGASQLEHPSENEIVTPEMRLLVDGDTLCVTVIDRTHDPELTLTTICPQQNEDDINGLTFSQEGTTDIYGLGEQFRRRGGTDGNWMGNRRLMTNTYGNGLIPFNGGNVANAQFPIMYALGEGFQNYAVFVDHAYQQFWAFNADPFIMQTSNAPIRWYMMTGDNLQDLRSDYMELTGKSPVPPRQMFGLWVSEYGYDNWDELTGVLESMREADFPIDGFVLDLLWFGGIGAQSQMGSLAWDEENFPDPQGFIANLRETYGIGIMTIEEPFVSQTAIGYEEASEQGVLVKICVTCPPVTMNEWWGRGGMVDWSNPEAGAWWHDNRRQHLVDDGVMGHWTDLGEPENYSETAWYFGVEGTNRHDHASIHNLYNLLWSQSIWDGYERNDVQNRPFILSRSGTSGSQRYGVAMWSGDIATNMTSLAEHMNVQLHMSLGGIDYFGADIGGFYRQAFDPVLGMEGMYTIWMANASLLDIPLRPHASNTQNRYQTAPSLIGDVPSNLANVRLRYEISPYLYTLAHQAFRTGEAIFPPLVYHFQDDPLAREIGSQKMIGAQMMMATLTDYDPEITTVYLPQGGWFNYHTGEYIQSTGETVDVTAEGIIQAPLFVRDGAIIPIMRVDDNTLNTLGQRVDGITDNRLIANIYHATEGNTFTLIEDDGKTIAYRDGAVRETPITLQRQTDALLIEVGAGNGTFDGAEDVRQVEFYLHLPTMTVESVRINGQTLSEIALTNDGAGWTRLDSGVVLVRSEILSVSTPLTIHITPAEESTLPADRPLFLAHYMPWYQTPDVSGYWGWHWTMNHFNPNQVDENNRPEFASHYMPLTGLYDLQDPIVLEYQVLLMKLSGIDGVIVDWYGTSNYNDYGTLHTATIALFDMISRAGLKFVICYEDRTIRTMVNDGHLDNTTAVEQGTADMRFAHDNWFGSEAYVTHEGQPLVFVFGPLYFRQLSDWTTMFTDMNPQPALVTLDNNLSFAAIGSYPWPPMSFSGGLELHPAVLQSYLDQFYRNARRSDLIVGSAFPGFHDIYEQANLHPSYGYLDARDGQTLRDTFTSAIEADARIVQLVTWNDYGEGTTIEPTEEYGYEYLEIIQTARQEQDASFDRTPDDLRLPMRLYEARHQHKGNADINLQLDGVFDAIVGGDLDTARAILDSLAN